MDVEVVNYIFKPGPTKLAILTIKYHELLMKCELVYFPSENKVWVRMPELWLNPHKKFSCAWWPRKAFSDEFQKVVLNKIFDKYDLSVEKVAEMHKSNIKKKN